MTIRINFQGALLTSASVDLLRESMNLALSELHGGSASY
jgi:hypothetical protein